MSSPGVPDVVFLGARAVGDGVWGLSYGYAAGRRIELLVQDHAITDDVIEQGQRHVATLAATLTNIARLSRLTSQ